MRGSGPRSATFEGSHASLGGHLKTGQRTLSGTDLFYGVRSSGQRDAVWFGVTAVRIHRQVCPPRRFQLQRKRKAECVGDRLRRGQFHIPSEGELPSAIGPGD
jgi:hypothetical protein